MKKSHAGFWVGLALVFLAAVYSAIVFLVKTTFDVSAWMLYSFTMAAFLLMAVQAVAASRKGSGIVMDTALGLVTLLYFGLQLIFGGVICMCFSGLPMTAVLVCEILLLAAYLGIAFMMYAAQSHSAAQERNDQQSESCAFWRATFWAWRRSRRTPRGSRPCRRWRRKSTSAMWRQTPHWRMLKDASRRTSPSFRRS